LNGNPAELFIPLEHFVKLGYRKFKLIDQYTLASLSERSFYKQQRNYFFRILRKGLKTLKIYPLQVLPRQWYQKKFRRIFSEDSSGPFGEMLKGEWYTAELMRKIINDRFKEFDASDPVRLHIFWVDLHATF
jgi:hypothetical protein